MKRECDVVFISDSDKAKPDVAVVDTLGVWAERRIDFAAPHGQQYPLKRPKLWPNGLAAHQLDARSLVGKSFIQSICN